MKILRLLLPHQTEILFSLAVYPSPEMANDRVVAGWCQPQENAPVQAIETISTRSEVSLQCKRPYYRHHTYHHHFGTLFWRSWRLVYGYESLDRMTGSTRCMQVISRRSCNPVKRFTPFMRKITYLIELGARR